MKPEMVRFRLKGRGSPPLALNNFNMLASVPQETPKSQEQSHFSAFARVKRCSQQLWGQPAHPALPAQPDHPKFRAGSFAKTPKSQEQSHFSAFARVKRCSHQLWGSAGPSGPAFLHASSSSFCPSHSLPPPCRLPRKSYARRQPCSTPAVLPRAIGLFCRRKDAGACF